MKTAVLTISSKNYGAWALRGWLCARLAGLEFTEHVISPDDPAMKAEMLLLSIAINLVIAWRVNHVRDHFSVRYLSDAKVQERKILMQST